jgi:hypothetical protein
VVVRLPTAEEGTKKSMKKMIMMTKKTTTITMSLLPDIRNMMKMKRNMMTMIMRMMKTMIMSNLIPGMKMKTRTKITVAVAAMKKTTITAAAPDSHGDRASNATLADNTKAGAKEANTAAKAVPARARGTRTRADARHPAAAGATLLMIAIRQHATPAKVAVADQTADHPRTTVALPLLPVVAVH